MVREMKRRLLSMLLSLALCVMPAATVLADERDDPPPAVEELENQQETPEYWHTAAPTIAVGEPIELTAKSAILMEASTGRVLYELQADDELPPASVTKIMTILLIVEAIDSGKITLDDPVTCSTRASQMGGSQIWLKEGETMSVHELLKATVIGSANDATLALAEYVGGSEEAFISMMNQRAAELGMEHTVFVNTNGLPAEGHYSSARDIALMSRELLRHSLIFDYTTIWMDSLRNGETQLVNTNKLIRFYNGATGLKTGSTDEAGYCLSATASRDDLDLIAVVLGSPSGAERFDDAKRLLDYGFSNYTIVTPTLPAEFATYPVEKGETDSVTPVPGEVAPVLMEKGKAGSVTVEVSEPVELQAPVEQGQQIGTIRVLLDGQEISQTPLYAAQGVKKLSLWMCFKRMLEGLFTLS